MIFFITIGLAHIPFSIVAVKAYYNLGEPDFLMTDHYLEFIH